MGVIDRGQLISAARGAGGPRPVQVMRFFDDRYPNAGRRFSIADDVDTPAHLFSRKGRGAVLIEVRVRQEEEGIPKGCALDQYSWASLQRQSCGHRCALRWSGA